MPKQTPRLAVALRTPLLVVIVVTLLVSAIMAVVSRPEPVRAATNGTINFQARLLTASGSVVPDGNYNIEFKLYNAASSTGSSQGSCSGDAACLWTETRVTSNKVRVVNGYLTVNLGSVTAFPGTINWDQELWLTMNVGGTGTPGWDGEMSPRLKLTAVPYAFRASKLVGGSGSNMTILDAGTPSGANTISLPAESGTLCIQNSANCGFALSTGSGNYIQNQNASVQTANFWISGIGRADIALQSPSIRPTTNGTTAIQFQNAAGSATALSVDTTNSRVSIGNGGTAFAPQQALDVIGNIQVRDAATAARSYRLRTSGSSLDFEAGGANMHISVWSDAAYTGTQRNYLVLENSNHIAQAIGTWQFRTAAGGTTRHTLDGTTGTSVAFNQNAEATNFSVQGDTDANLFFIQGSTDRVGIGNNTPGYKLDVTGDINISAASSYRIGGTAICTSSGCTPAAGSANYIRNTTTVQAANFYVQAAASGSVAGVLQANASGAANILELKNGAGVNVATFSNTGLFRVQDTNGDPVFTADTSSKQIVLGKAGASGITGKIVFQNATNANTITLQSGVTTAGYTLTLPTALGATGDCLKDAGSGALQFTSCGNFNGTLQAAYSAGLGGTTPEIIVDSTRGGVDIQDVSTPGTSLGTSPLFAVRSQATASTLGNKYFSIQGNGLVAIGNITATHALDVAGNINVGSGNTYKINGTDICTSAGCTAAATSAILNQSASNQTADFRISGVGRANTALVTPALRPVSDSTTALQVQNAAGTTTIINVDTTNARVGIGTTAPSRPLHIYTNNTTTNAPTLLVEQAGTGDTSIELKDANSKSFFIGMDASSGGAFKIASSTSAATSFNIGTTTNGANFASSFGNEVIAKKITTSASGGAVSSISLYVNAIDGTNPGAKVALYAHNAGSDIPGALIASTTTSQTLTANSWNTIPLSATISAGTTYWIAVNFQGGGTEVNYSYCAGCGGRSAGFTKSFGNTWPDPASAPWFTSNDENWSFYLTAVPAGTVDSFDGTSLLTMSDAGATTLRNSINSSTAFQIQNASGNEIFKVDTSASQVTLGKASTVAGKLVLHNASNANTVGLQSGVTSASYTLTLPTALGSAGSCLKDTTGAGVLGFATCVSDLQTAYNASTTPEIVLNSTNGALTVRDASSSVTNLIEVQNNAGNTTYFRVDTGGIFVTGTVNAGTGTHIGSAFRSGTQSAASTNSADTTFSSGQVSGATSNTGAVTLQSGASTTSGNTGTVTLQSGNATSGNSGNIVIDSGTASGTKGSISIGTANASAITLGNTSTNITTTVNGWLLAKPATGGDSANAFRVQNAGGNNVLQVDTSANVVAVGSIGQQVQLNVTGDIAWGTELTTPQGFESTTFPPTSPATWTTGGTAGWSRTTANAQAGTASAVSADVGNNQTSWLDLDYTFASTGTLSFYWKVSSEQDWDYLLFCFDNDSCSRTTGYSQRISGTVDWTKVTVQVPAGAHSFRWLYEKDSGDSVGSDVGWIDNVQFVSGGGTGTVRAQNLTFTGSDTVNFQTSGNANAIRIDTNGRVGINNAAPTEALTVQGNFNVTDSATAPTKQYRFRTSGSELDMEVAGADLFVSGWSGADFSGTQQTFLRGFVGTSGNSYNDKALFVGSSSASANPMILVLAEKTSASGAADPASSGFTGAMYYNQALGKMRCHESGAWRDCGTSILRVTADVSSTSTAFANITGLSASVSSGITYSFTCNLTYTTAISTTALHLSITGPAAPTALDYGVDVATGATTKHSSVQTAYDTVTNPDTSGGATRLTAQLNGTIIPSANGTLNLRLKSEVAASSVVVKRGSYCIFR